jgi:NitT/TauT family transport system substrate-binding protein
MKGWKWAEENPEDAAMIVLDYDETGAQTEEHQRAHDGRDRQADRGLERRAGPVADYERTVARCWPAARTR